MRGADGNRQNLALRGSREGLRGAEGLTSESLRGADKVLVMVGVRGTRNEHEMEPEIRECVVATSW